MQTEQNTKDVNVTDLSHVLSDEFYTKNGLRFVKPYFADYTAHSKGRWHGKTLIDVYMKEFPHYGRDYLVRRQHNLFNTNSKEKAIEAGRLTVENKKVAPTTKIGNNQLITHTVHRHEPPVHLLTCQL
jgi:tRNA pseudouridine synthase 9